jgi:hypothetical protein
VRSGLGGLHPLGHSHSALKGLDFCLCLESEWFDWYSPQNPTELLPLNQTQLYTEDWIGLRALDQVGQNRALDQVYHIKLLSKCPTLRTG